MTGRCVATNPAGAQCLYGAVHGNSGHLFADDPDRYPFLLGHLTMAVTLYLDGKVDRAFLAGALAETQAAL